MTGYYDEIAKKSNRTYFKLTPKQWKKLVQDASSDYDEIWKINKKFIDEQIAAGKEILLTNDPTKKYLFDDGIPRFYQRELNYLMELRYTFDEVSDGLWKASK